MRRFNRRKKRKYEYDLIVVGSGSGGSVGAHHAVSLGKKVALVEKGRIGGECPNFACVPTKALLHAAGVLNTIRSAKDYGIHPDEPDVWYAQVKQWKDLVVSRTGASEGTKSFEDEGITVIRGKAEFINPHEITVAGQTYSAEKFLVAPGSDVLIPPIEGLLDVGYCIFKDVVDFEKVPESMFVIGGGAVGCEFSEIFSTFGTKITIANRSRLLSNMDKDVSDLVKALFEFKGIRVLDNCKVSKVEKREGKKIIYYSVGEEDHQMAVDEILVATGKKASVDFSPQRAGIVDQNGRIPVNKYLQTIQPHIYAAGDFVGPYQFTHTAYYQSYIAVHNMYSYKKKLPDYRAVPSAVYISPEVATVGMTEEQAKEKEINIKIGVCPMSILGRSNTTNNFDGFVKVITDDTYHIIGASIVADRAGEMIHELTLAIKLGARAHDIADMIHAYPTYSEAIKIACSSVK